MKWTGLVIFTSLFDISLAVIEPNNLFVCKNSSGLNWLVPQVMVINVNHQCGCEEEIIVLGRLITIVTIRVQSLWSEQNIGSSSWQLGKLLWDCRPTSSGITTGWIMMWFQFADRMRGLTWIESQTERHVARACYCNIADNCWSVSNSRSLTVRHLFEMFFSNQFGQPGCILLVEALPVCIRRQKRQSCYLRPQVLR